MDNLKPGCCTDGNILLVTMKRLRLSRYGCQGDIEFLDTAVNSCPCDRCKRNLHLKCLEAYDSLAGLVAVIQYSTAQF